MLFAGEGSDLWHIRVDLIAPTKRALASVPLPRLSERARGERTKARDTEPASTKASGLRANLCSG